MSWVQMFLLENRQEWTVVLVSIRRALLYLNCWTKRLSLLSFQQMPEVWNEAGSRSHGQEEREGAETEAQ